MAEVDEALPFAFNEPRSNISREDNFAPDFTYAEQLSAAYDLGELSTPMISLARITSVRELEQNNRTKLEPGELNEIYPGLPVPFREPMSLPEADLIATRQQERAELQRRLAQGPDSFFYGASKFIAGMVPHVLDPLNIAGALAIGAGMGAALAGTRAGVALGVGVARPTAGQVFLRGATEGTLEAALISEPLAFQAAKSDLEEYGVEDVFINSVGAALGFSFARYGIVKTAQGVRLGLNKGAEFMGRFRGRQAEVLQRSAIAQMMQDRRVNLEPLIEDTVLDTMGDIPEGISVKPYAFTKLSSQQLGGKRFFAASETAVRNFSEGPSAILHEDFGDMVYLVDNAGVANGAAARKLSEIDGSVFEIELANDINLLDLNEPPSPAVLSELKKIFPDSEKVVKLEDKSLKQILSEVQDFMAIGKYGERALDRLNAAVRNMGFDGYHHDGGDFLGVKHDSANHVIVFDASKLKQTQVFKPDMTKVPRMDDERIRDLAEKTHSQENHVNWDDGVMRRAKLKELEPEVDTTFADLKKETEDLDLMVKDLEDQGLLDEFDVADLEDIKALKKDEALLEKIVNGAMSCLGRQR